ncbi:MAG: hypothetical protein V4618_10695 [Pseudomonadota bacterium]
MIAWTRSGEHLSARVFSHIVKQHGSKLPTRGAMLDHDGLPIAIYEIVRCSARTSANHC